MRVRTTVIAFFCALPIGGCNTHWAKPNAGVPTADRFREQQTSSAPPVAGAPEFLAKFHSKELNWLVQQALDHNLDIEAAVARIAQADAQTRVASASLWPQVAGAAGLGRAQYPAGTATGASSSTTANRLNFLSLGLTASYEIDFWGKNDFASKAAAQLANASRFDRDVIRIAAVASVMNVYFQILAAQDRLRDVRENVRIASAVLDVVRAKLKSGVATRFDYSQQETILATALATVPPLEQSIRQAKHQLAVLIGQPPESVVIKGGTLAALSTPAIAAGLPSEVLLRRPDVAEAESKLVSQEFSVLQARAALFPSIKLTGQYGLPTVVLKNLLRPEAIGWELAAGLAQPLFDGGNLQGQFHLQQARYAEQAASYRKQAIVALSDVEDALTAVQESVRLVRLQGNAAAAARRAYSAAQARLKEGVIDAVSLSSTQAALFQNRDLLQQARLQHFRAAVSLYQALGGGWSPTVRESEIARSVVSHGGDGASETAAR